MTDEILAIFEEQNPDGTYVYTDEEVRNFIPTLFVLSGKSMEDDDLSPSLKNAMLEFLERMNLPTNASPQDIATAISISLVVKPLNPTLLDKLRQTIAA